MMTAKLVVPPKVSSEFMEMRSLSQARKFKPTAAVVSSKLHLVAANSARLGSLVLSQSGVHLLNSHLATNL